MGIKEAAPEEPFLMGVDIDEVAGGSSAQHLGHVAIKDPEVAIIPWGVAFRCQSDSRQGTSRRLCHGCSYVQCQGDAVTVEGGAVNGSRGCLKSSHEATGENADVTIVRLLDLPYYLWFAAGRRTYSPPT